jgi:Tfp pilus assembly PilM family ATPase
MAKRGNSVIGIDLGKHVLKGVLLHRKGDARYVLTSYASRQVPEDLATADDLAANIC